MLRYLKPDGKKDYRPLTWGHIGTLPPGWERKSWIPPRPLYGLDLLAVRPTSQVLICEGEKGTVAARVLFPDMVAITWPGGAQAVQYADLTPLTGRRCVLFPDNDDPGIEAMAELSAALHKLGATVVKGIRVTDMPPGWDIADADNWTPEHAVEWAKGDLPDGTKRIFTYQNDVSDSGIVSHGTLENPNIHDSPPLTAYSEADIPRTASDTDTETATQPAHAPARLVGIYDQQHTGPKPTAASLGVIQYRGSERQPKARDWLWRDKIACGVITGLSGDPGLGKSQITASLAAIVTTGGRWPVTRDQAPKGSVIILNCEDDFDTTIAPRLIAAGADMDKIHVFDGVQTVSNQGIPASRIFDLSQDINRLVAMMQDIGDVRLVIIDPISAYVGNGKVDSHNNTDVRSVLAPLTKAAEANHETGKLGAAILIINHLNKDSSKSALHRTQGSVAWTAAPRCIWAVIRDKEDESGRTRLMMCVKNNIGPDTDGFRYEVEGFHLTDSDPLIETSRILWHTDVVTANAEHAFQDTVAAEEKTAITEAEHFLRDALAMGWTRTAELQLSSRKAGHSWATICRAKTRLKVKATRQGGMGSSGAWGWDLPLTAADYRAK